MKNIVFCVIKKKKQQDKRRQNNIYYYYFHCKFQLYYITIHAVTLY